MLSAWLEIFWHFNQVAVIQNIYSQPSRQTSGLYCSLVKRQCFHLIAKSSSVTRPVLTEAVSWWTRSSNDKQYTDLGNSSPHILCVCFLWHCQQVRTVCCATLNIIKENSISPNNYTLQDIDITSDRQYLSRTNPLATFVIRRFKFFIFHFILLTPLIEIY